MPFDPPLFDPTKLTVIHLDGVSTSHPPPLPSLRRYTLTHNDITSRLLLSVGSCYNQAQLTSWYVGWLRDEVLAEWVWDAAGAPSLHVHCHVSGEHRWLAPPQLRNYIFRHEMPLVRPPESNAWLREIPQERA